MASARCRAQYTDNLPEVHDVLRELRQVTNEYPGRVLIGETYLPNRLSWRRCMGRTGMNCICPWTCSLGFINRLSVADFRRKLFEAETQLNGNPAVVRL